MLPVCVHTHSYPPPSKSIFRVLPTCNLYTRLAQDVYNDTTSNLCLEGLLGEECTCV